MSATNGPDAWAAHNAQWRDPAQVVSQWEDASQIDQSLVGHVVRGSFWDAIEGTGATLLVTREYEHLVLALTTDQGRPRVSYLRLPHPSGVAVDRGGGRVYVASTRNPNQVFELEAVASAVERVDAPAVPRPDRPLVPRRSAFFPGSLYMHDLALIGGRLHANAVGHNAVIEIENGNWRRVWWPSSIEVEGRPEFGINYLQLNSIAAGEDLASSFFSASAERPSARRPGHLNFPVDHRGVIFSGETREVAVRGLTRPHSARLHEDRLWVANSGYGELSYADDGSARAFCRLPGWTRGLCFVGGLAFVSTSRVIPRFSAYAPGLDVERSVCGLHAVDLASGKILGSLTWPAGNQIFAVDWISRDTTLGLPFPASTRRAPERDRSLFYTFDTDTRKDWETTT
jgi:uncharacterized protein (TIGR03032 family)